MTPLLRCIYAVTPPGRSRMAKAGFSLAELLFAIGILGVGMIMAAGLFAAGLRQNKSSTDDVLGTIICKNAGAILQARVTKLEMDTYLLGSPRMPSTVPGQDIHLIDESLAYLKQVLGPADMFYPTPKYSYNYPPGEWIPQQKPWQESWQDENVPPRPNNSWRDTRAYPITTRGWVAFVRRLGDPNVNDYLFTVVAYDKMDNQHYVTANALEVTFETDEDDITMMTLEDPGAFAGYLREGTVIVLPNGEYAIAEAVDTELGQARLNRTVNDFGSNVVRVWMVYESPLDEYDRPYSGFENSNDWPNSEADDRPSPVIKVMTLRTSLRQP